jgi:hypothetical protein
MHPVKSTFGVADNKNIGEKMEVPCDAPSVTGMWQSNVYLEEC